jgi:hypothetical protein
MAESYWTHCMYCHEMICGVEILEDYPDIVVLYAHKDCHERHTHARTITAAAGREDPKDVRTDLPGDVGSGRTDAEL